ncbi:MAG: SDR family NAD(P)-dependent oxidoreductase [Nanoarchaeota archaeon]|nr:SDR family NAD(P)-dependent oxidoreductase [Nanoarchaeota archaeon]
MKTILVTGAAGFIGSSTCEKLIKKKYIVVGVDNLNDYYSPKVKLRNVNEIKKDPKFRLYQTDIRDFNGIEKIFAQNKIDKVIHLAARAGVRPSLEQPRLYFDVNVNGTLILLELAKEFKVKNFVFASSSSVYGENKKVPFSEEDLTEDQISPYASSKKSGELICRTYSHLFNMNVSCLRFFTVYGPRGRPDMAPFIFTDLISKGRTIDMYGDGTSKRDYTYIDDITDGIIGALEKDFRFEIFNLGNSDPIPLKNFISIIEKNLGKKAKIKKKPMQQGDVLITYADIAKAKKMLGYNPKTDIEQGMKKFIEWYKKNNS